MFIELLFLAAGIIPGRIMMKGRAPFKPIGWAITASILFLLFSLGCSIGSDKKLFSMLGVIWVAGVASGFSCLLFSAIVGRLFQPIFDKTGKAGEAKKEKKFWKNMSGSFLILAFFMAGVVLGHKNILPNFFLSERLTLYALRAMLFCVGISIGYALHSLLLIKDLGVKTVLVPVFCMLGSFVGASVLFMLLPGFTFMESQLVGSAYGYYSLASVVVSQSYSQFLGSVVLFANCFRELFVLVTAPVLVRFFGPVGAISAAGATSMDVTLPVIIRSSSESYGVIALLNGIVLSIVVPVLLPFVIQLAKVL